MNLDPGHPIAAGKPRFLRTATLAMLLVALPSCRSWQEWEGPPEAALRKEHDRVRVIRGDGRQVTIVSPALAGDSLIGTSLFGPMGVPGGRIAIATAEIRQLQVHRISGGRTVWAIVGGGAALLVAGAVIAAATSDGPPPRPRNGRGSCPLVYSWDGERWRLDSGTFGGAITEALARTDVDNLDYATSTDGIVRLKVANELAETDYLDALRLLAVDHPFGTTVAPTSEGAILALNDPRPPTAARGPDGADALPQLIARDGWSWESPLRRASGETLRDVLELEFPRPASQGEARLLVDAHNTTWATYLLEEYLLAHGEGLDAWYAALDGDPVRARSFFGRLAEQAFLEVSILTEDGWRPQALVWEAGPEIVKRQVATLDLSRVRGETVRVRLSAPTSFWRVDHAAIDYGPAPAVTVHQVGIDAAHRPDGADVRSELSAQDGRYWVPRTGDSAEVTFRVPSPPRGSERTYLLASTGWYRLDARRDGPPDLATLRRIEEEPDAIARISRERREDALSTLIGTAASR